MLNALTTMLLPLPLPDLPTPLTHVECPHCNATATAQRLTHQVRQASPQLIMLDYMSGWGVNGSLVTLLPIQPLPLLTPSPCPSMAASSSHGLSTGAMAGLVVGSIAGAAILTGAAALLLLHRCVWHYLGVHQYWGGGGREGLQGARGGVLGGRLGLWGCVWGLGWGYGSVCGG